MADNPVVRMDQHFDVDATLEAVAKERFAMPPPVIAAFRQAAMGGAGHLLNLINDKENFSKLKVQDQLRVLEMVFDRAYGKSETASTSMTALHKTGQGNSSDHGKQLDQMEQRMKKRNSNFPELKSSRSARRIGTIEDASDGNSCPSEVEGEAADAATAEQLPPMEESTSEATASKITRLNSLTVGTDDEVAIPELASFRRTRGRS